MVYFFNPIKTRYATCMAVMIILKHTLANSREVSDMIPGTWSYVHFNFELSHPSNTIIFFVSFDQQVLFPLVEPNIFHNLECLPLTLTSWLSLKLSRKTTVRQESERDTWYFDIRLFMPCFIIASQEFFELCFRFGIELEEDVRYSKKKDRYTQFDGFLL
jgi:hypothetical protein